MWWARGRSAERGIRFQCSPWEVDSETKWDSFTCCRTMGRAGIKYVSSLLPLQVLPWVDLVQDLQGCPSLSAYTAPFLRGAWSCLGLLVTHPRNQRNRSSWLSHLQIVQTLFYTGRIHTSNSCFSCTNPLTPIMSWRGMLSYSSSCTFSSCRGP